MYQRPSGQRTRYWDGCLTEDFAKCSLGEGACENFRDERASRFRHRMMRKATYLNEKLGGPACVGCGTLTIGGTSTVTVDDCVVGCPPPPPVSPVRPTSGGK